MLFLGGFFVFERCRSFVFPGLEDFGRPEGYARRQVEDAWKSTHKDHTTGLYNWNGLLARAVEMVADAQRSQRWTACVALGPGEGQSVVSSEEFANGSSDDVLKVPLSDPPVPRLLDRIAATLLEATRDSDSTGILSTNDTPEAGPRTSGSTT